MGDDHTQPPSLLADFQHSGIKTLGAALLIEGGATGAHFSESHQVLRLESLDHFIQAATVLFFLLVTKSWEVLVVLNSIYRTAFINGQDGQRWQVGKECAQAYLAIVEDRVRRIHNAVGGFHIP